MSKRVRVVAAVILRDGRVLIAKKRPGRSLAGYWEFPGGKIEDHESPESALERELLEEFSIGSKVGKLIGVSVFRYPDIEVELAGYWVTHFSGEFELRDHDEIRWVLPSELSSYQLAPADVPLATQIGSALTP